jgi:hypothetical protein
MADTDVSESAIDLIISVQKSVVISKNGVFQKCHFLGHRVIPLGFFVDHKATSLNLDQIATWPNISKRAIRKTMFML